MHSVCSAGAGAAQQADARPEPNTAQALADKHPAAFTGSVPAQTSPASIHDKQPQTAAHTEPEQPPSPAAAPAASEGGASPASLQALSSLQSEPSQPRQAAQALHQPPTPSAAALAAAKPAAAAHQQYTARLSTLEPTDQGSRTDRNSQPAQDAVITEAAAAAPAQAAGRDTGQAAAGLEGDATLDRLFDRLSAELTQDMVGLGPAGEPPWQQAVQRIFCGCLHHQQDACCRLLPRSHISALRLCSACMLGHSETRSCRLAC